MLTAHVLNSVWFVEQPGSSILYLHRRFQWFIRTLKKIGIPASWSHLSACEFGQGHFVRNSVEVCMPCLNSQDLSSSVLDAEVFSLDSQADSDMVLEPHGTHPRHGTATQKRQGKRRQWGSKQAQQEGKASL